MSDALGVPTGHVPGAPRLAFDEAGHGDAVVFLHGIGGNRTNWRDQLASFAAAGRRAIAWDARGWGDSDDYEGALDFADFSADLLRLMAHRGLERADFVGLSMGGFILQDFVQRHPQRVRSLVLADTSRGPMTDHGPQWVEDFLAARRTPLLAGRTLVDIAPAVARSLAGRAATPEVVRRLEASIATLHRDSYLKAMETVTRYVIPAGHAAIAVPVLVLVGADDALTPPDAARRLADAIPGAVLETIADAGHLSNIERPEAFDRAVLAFLARRP
jgi:3-oxoadipate enol-lactonase